MKKAELNNLNEVIDNELRLKMYKIMLKIRLFEEEIYPIYTHGLMPGLAHLSIGQEACAVGVIMNLREDDYLSTTHRGHGHLIAKGCDIKRMIAEVMGKQDGYCKGKGGTMHITNFALGILGANAIVAGGIPMTVGAGYSIKYRGTDQVAVSFFGDGATNQGAFHEALNMASLWDLPVIFVAENNLYGISVSQSRHQKIKDISTRASAYGIPGKTVDGNDVEAVFLSSREAIQRARNGGGPTLLELKTYRWGGHHVGDPGTVYRPKEEIAEWKRRCPIKLYQEKLSSIGVLTKKMEQKIREDISKEIEEAVEFAKASPLPTPESALEDLFYEIANSQENAKLEN
jgi:TPP-dependent pyruvate/acetoin dehydrogenase alpha subunit